MGAEYIIRTDLYGEKLVIVKVGGAAAHPDPQVCWGATLWPVQHNGCSAYHSPKPNLETCEPNGWKALTTVPNLRGNQGIRFSILMANNLPEMESLGNLHSPIFYPFPCMVMHTVLTSDCLWPIYECGEYNIIYLLKFICISGLLKYIFTYTSIQVSRCLCEKLKLLSLNV